MKKLIVLAILASACAPSKISKTITYANFAEENCLACFYEGAGGGKSTCETSAIIYNNGNILVANDKDSPNGQTAVFKYSGSLTDTTKRSYLQNVAFKNAKKFEDFAQTPDKNWIFLTTGFDRVKEGSTDWDGFNTILYWPAGQEESPKILSSIENAKNSMDIRAALQTVLANDAFPGKMPYLKIEGLAATQTHLYFGVRETGKSYSDFKYAIKIIVAPFSISKDKISLGEMKLLSDLSIDPSWNIPTNMGISSLEYDAANSQFVILTSFEQGENLSGYVFTATPEELATGKMKPVLALDQRPLTFKHKAEDITFLDKNTALIIHDDDRIKTTYGTQTRQWNQAVFTKIMWR